MGKERFEKETSRDSKRKPIPPKKIYFVYQTVAQIISKALNQEGTLRGLVYEHAKTLVKTHLRLAIEVARHRSLLDRLLTETGLAEKEHLEPDLAQVLVYELVLGQCKQLPEGFDVFDRVGAHKQHLQKALRKIQRSGDLQNLVIDKPEARVPRYGRVNTLVASLESVVENLQRRGFTLVDTEGKSYQEFLDCVRGLEDGQFLLDFHFPRDLLVFSPRQLLANLFVHKAGHLVVQDKTSYFPVACLAAPPGSTVLDACAAPGMKTVHIAAKMNNHGRIYAFDPHESRFANLKSNLEISGVTCCTAKCLDFTEVHPLKPPSQNVEYLLLDPPCTGSGIVNRLDELTDREQSKSFDRVRGLSALQFKLLCHAAKFASVKRIVYSTCSTEVQENEQVIKDFIDKNQDRFRLANALPEWPTRGKPEFEFGSLCVRSWPETDLTNGFFVAVLERIVDDSSVAKGSRNREENTSASKLKVKKRDPNLVAEASGDVRGDGTATKPKGRREKRIYIRKRLKRGKREREQHHDVEVDAAGASTVYAKKSPKKEDSKDLVSKKRKRSQEFQNGNIISSSFHKDEEKRKNRTDDSETSQTKPASEKKKHKKKKDKNRINESEGNSTGANTDITGSPVPGEIKSESALAELSAHESSGIGVPLDSEMNRPNKKASAPKDSSHDLSKDKSAKKKKKKKEKKRADEDLELVKNTKNGCASATKNSNFNHRESNGSTTLDVLVGLEYKTETKRAIKIQVSVETDAVKGEDNEYRAFTEGASSKHKKKKKRDVDRSGDAGTTTCGMERSPASCEDDIPDRKKRRKSELQSIDESVLVLEGASVKKDVTVVTLDNTLCEAYCDVPQNESTWKGEETETTMASFSKQSGSKKVKRASENEESGVRSVSEDRCSKTAHDVKHKSKKKKKSKTETEEVALNQEVTDEVETVAFVEPTVKGKKKKNGGALATKNSNFSHRESAGNSTLDVPVDSEYKTESKKAIKIQVSNETDAVKGDEEYQAFTEARRNDKSHKKKKRDVDGSDEAETTTDDVKHRSKKKKKSKTETEEVALTDEVGAVEPIAIVESTAKGKKRKHKEGVVRSAEDVGTSLPDDQVSNGSAQGFCLDTDDGRHQKKKKNKRKRDQSILCDNETATEMDVDVLSSNSKRKRKEK